MALLTREQIKAVQRKTVDVEVPEWNGIVRLAELSGLQVQQAADLMVAAKGGSEKGQCLQAQLVAMHLVDEAGQQLDGDPEFVNELSRLSARVLKQLSDKCMELDGFAEEGRSGN